MSSDPCTKCNGSGQVDVMVDTDEGPQPFPVQCDACRGTGRA